jgi:hypothetical protein
MSKNDIFKKTEIRRIRSELFQKGVEFLGRVVGPRGMHIGPGYIKYGTGYEYDGNVFVAWVLQVRRAEVVTK